MYEMSKNGGFFSKFESVKCALCYSACLGKGGEIFPPEANKIYDLRTRTVPCKGRGRKKKCVQCTGTTYRVLLRRKDTTLFSEPD